MIIPDTSVWIDHFRGVDTPLATAVSATRRWLLHPFVFGELLLGGLPKYSELLDQIGQLRPAPVAAIPEVAAFIQWTGLAGTGIGYVDTHLLVAARMASAQVLTSDKRLQAQAERLGLAYGV